MSRGRRVLVLFVACGLLAVSGRALVVDRGGAPRRAGRSGPGAAAEVSTHGDDIVLAAEQAEQSLVLAVHGDALGAPTVDLAALLCAAFLVAIALVPARGRHRARPAVLLRGPPRPLVR